MPDQTWQDIAREWVEPWEGARVLLDDGLSYLRIGDDPKRPLFVSMHGSTLRWHPHSQRLYSAAVIAPPDLTHPPTAREGVARLALFLGAPEDAVAEGALFYNDIRNGGGGAWVIEAGCGPDWSFMFELDHDDAPADQRPLAIATAWRKARMAKECEG